MNFKSKMKLKKMKLKMKQIETASIWLIELNLGIYLLVFVL